MAKKSPRWVRESEQHITSYVKRFNDSLRRIAIRFAHHGRADTIDAMHVDQAFEALVRFGLKRQAWWKRSELKITLGAVFVGAAMCIPDFAPLLIDKAERQAGVSIGLITTFGILGGIFYLWGWFQGKI